MQTKCPICGHKTTHGRIDRFIRKMAIYAVDCSFAGIKEWVRKNKSKK